MNLFLTLYVFITFDKFKAFLLNKMNLFKKTHTDPKLLNVSVTVTMLAGFESLIITCALDDPSVGSKVDQ